MASNNGERKGKGGFIALVTILTLIIVAIIAGIALLVVRGDIFSKTVPATGGTSEEVLSQSDFEFSFASSAEEPTEASESVQANSAEENNPAETAQVPPIDASVLKSSRAYMIRTTDDATLLDKGSTEKIYPASMTKVMTAYLACLNLTDLNEMIPVIQEDIDPAFLEEGTRAGLEAGDSVTVQDMMASALLPSGGEACYALARRVSGSYDAFTEAMNQKAAELGMSSTHFTNPAGFHNDDHYSTCADIARLMKAAIENETFRKIVSLSSYTTGATSVYPTGILMYSTFLMHVPDVHLSNGVTIEGGKTGFTDEAGHCLASFAKDAAGTEYILVTAGAEIEGDEDDPNTDQTPHVTDALNIYKQLP